MGATGVIEPTHVRRARARRAARPIAVIAVVGGVLSIAVLARAHWTQSGTGTAAAGVGTLIAPAGVVATPTFGATSVPVSWNGVAAPGGGAVDGYYVQRSSGGTSVAACASSPSTLLPPGAGGCTDAGVPDGTYAYTVTAVFRSWTAGSDPSAPVAVVALASFTVTAPAGATAAVPFSVTVTAKDQSNQTILGYVGTVIITSSDPNGSVPADYTFGPGDDGSHTFTNGVTLDTAGSQTVAVNDAADVWKTGSATVVVAVGAPAQLGFTQQPGGGTAAVAWPTQPKVAIQDAGGNTVTTASASVTLAITSGTGNPSGVLTCTTNPRSTSAGVATFAGCRINLPGTGFTVTASSSGLAAATSAAFDVVAGAPTKVVYVQQPTAAVAGSAINPAIAVAIEDANGNVVTSSNATVTIAIGTNPGGGTLSGTTSVAATNGVATFTDLSIDRAANNYRLAASSAGLTGATSATFNVAAGPAAQLGFTQQPGGGSGGIAWGTQPKVAVQDALGNTVTGASASVTLAITPSTGDPAGALTCNANPKTTNSGVASFGGCKINPPGASYSLTATAAGFDLVLSDPFDISIGPATKLVLTQQPSTVVAGSTIAPAVVAAIQDAGGNTVTSSSATVTIAIGTNPGGGTLSGTTSVDATNGVVTFSDLWIDRSGNGYKLRLTSSGLSNATSSAFNVTVGTATQLGFTQQPGGGSAGTAWSTQPKVAIQDAYGNTVTTASGSVTLSITGGTGDPSGVLTCSVNPKATNSGVAGFTGCKINLAGTGYTLTATAAVLTAAVSTPLTIS